MRAIALHELVLAAHQLWILPNLRASRYNAQHEFGNRCTAFAGEFPYRPGPLLRFLHAMTVASTLFDAPAFAAAPRLPYARHKAACCPRLSAISAVTE